jgi:hypothetical protein
MSQPPEGHPPPQDVPSLDEHVDQALRYLQGELSRRDRPAAFSREALARLLDRQTEYLTELGIESIRVARRAENDEVQAVNVSEAERRVRAEHSAARELGLAFGGLVGGGGLSLLVAELTIETPNVPLTITALIIVVVTMAVLLWSIVGRRSR